MDEGQVLQILKRLRTGRDIDAIKHTISGLSGPAGPIKSFSVSFDTKRRTVSCFLEMRSPMPDSEVRELNACGFGNGLWLEFGLAASPARPD